MITRLIATLVALLILVHGYFYLSFGTVDPCVAATFKVINKSQSQAARGAGLLFSAAIEKVIRSKGVWACYRTAVTGEAPDGLP